MSEIKINVYQKLRESFKPNIIVEEYFEVTAPDQFYLKCGFFEPLLITSKPSGYRVVTWYDKNFDLYSITYNFIINEKI